VITKTFGLDWTLKDNLPNILSDIIAFQFPINDADDDDADTHEDNKEEKAPKTDHIIEDIMVDVERELAARGA